jgi:hypothetical protein
MMYGTSQFAKGCWTFHREDGADVNGVLERPFVYRQSEQFAKTHTIIMSP